MLPLILCGLVSAGVMLIFCIGILVGAHRRMGQHGAYGYGKNYRVGDLSWKEDNRGVPGWYTTPYIDEDGNVYDYPLTPRPKMGREL